MSKSSLWRTICLMCIFSLVVASGARAQSITTLLSFGAAGYNAKLPQGPLVQGFDGNFYGTDSGNGGVGALGVVFEISAGGNFNTIHTFLGNGDAREPNGGLLQTTNGNLFGTTLVGGNHLCGGGNGSCGTLFDVTPAGN